MHSHSHSDANHGAIHANQGDGSPGRSRRSRDGRVLVGYATDPTRTKTIRDQYARQVRKRYRAVARAVRDLVNSGYLDSVLEANQPGDRPSPLPVPDAPIPRTPDYDFPTGSGGGRQAQNAFSQWLRDTQNAVVLGGGNAGDARWTDDYVRYAHGRGVVHGNHRLRNAGFDVPDVELRDAFRTPIHRDTLEQFYQRQFSLLQGVNESMDAEISRILSDGVLAGENPRVIGREMSNTVQNIGIRRGNLIARTEVIHGYNEASLNRYEQILGSEGELEAVVEFQTAGDSRVCPQCQTLAGSIYTVQDARNVIPVHPACRCTWIPRSQSATTPTPGGSGSGSGPGDGGPPPRPVASIADDQLGRDVTDTTKIDHIEDAIDDNLSIDSGSLKTLDAERASTLARSLERLDERDALSNVNRIETMQSSAKAIASFRWSPGGVRTLRVNPAKFKADEVRSHIKNGWITGDPDRPLESTLYHELGHSKHFEALEEFAEAEGDDAVALIKSVRGDAMDGLEEKRLSEQVGQYSTTNPTEAVAELFAKQSLGDDIGDDKLEALYERFHGPDPIPDDPLATNVARRGTYTRSEDELSGMASYDEDDLPEAFRDERDRTLDSLQNLIDAYESDDDE